MMDSLTICRVKGQTMYQWKYTMPEHPTVPTYQPTIYSVDEPIDEVISYVKCWQTKAKITYLDETI